MKTKSKKLKKYARKCDKCGKLFNEGYCIESGENYYCSEKCLYKVMTKKEFLKLYAKGEGDSYWTSWEDDYQFYENGEEIK